MNADVGGFLNIGRPIQRFDVILRMIQRPTEHVGNAFGCSGSVEWFQRKPVIGITNRSSARVLSRGLRVWRRPSILPLGPGLDKESGKGSVNDRNARTNDAHVGFYDAPLYYDHGIIYTRFQLTFFLRE